MKLFKNKTGGVMDNLSALFIGLASLSIIAVVVFVIMGQIASNSTVAADPNATLAIEQIQGAADDIPGWIPLVVIAVIGSILIGLVAYFRGRS